MSWQLFDNAGRNPVFWKRDETDERRSQIRTSRRRHAGCANALLRASLRAREIARQTNIVIVRDGSWVE